MIAKCVQINIRLYSPEDDALLKWYAAQGDHYGGRTHAIKQALKQGISASAEQTPALDMVEMRNVVEAAVTTAMARFDVTAINGNGNDEDENEKAEQLLANLGNALTLEEQ